jgi:hypothetical protein
MKLINGMEMIDNSPNEKAGELAEAIYDDVLFILDIEHKCIQEDEDGNTSDTEYGQDLFNCIYEQCMNYFERESHEWQRLSDDELDKIVEGMDLHVETYAGTRMYGRLIEQKLKEKNT